MKILFAAVAALVLTAGTSFAGTDPNLNCAKQSRMCVKACDDAADTGKNAKAYQKCLDNCDQAEKSCSDRQDLADHCAAAFKPCIANAHSEADRESCRKSYRQCKDTD